MMHESTIIVIQGIYRQLMHWELQQCLYCIFVVYIECLGAHLEDCADSIEPGSHTPQFSAAIMLSLAVS